jgi:glutamine amidotransferase
MIVIVNYGLGNLRSILQKFEMLSIPAIVSNDTKDLRDANKLILPGVGHFAEGMRNLHESGLKPVLDELVLRGKKPILGICLGMQLFTEFSEEGEVAGLGWIPAQTKRFKMPANSSHLRIPHVGWNSLKLRRDNPLFVGVDPQRRYYFTHSYCVTCANTEDVVATSNYGVDFHSVVARGNIYGTQFHPEKSHNHGLHLIKNFVERCV